jgi:uncharacterized protein (TIGR01777 family)
MKTILIAGASGFVGTYLSRMLIQEGYAVIGLGTSGRHPLEKKADSFDWVCADTTMPGEWQGNVEKADIVINLTGRSIFKPWTKAYKKAIYDSRILTTKHLVEAMPDNWGGHLLNTSAIGFYGDRGEDELSEADGGGDDFLAHVCRDWEAQALKAVDKEGVVSLMRFGVVLGDGGALTVMGRAFKWFAGGPLGSGNHWFPWIHIQDLGRAVLFLMGQELGGIFNFTGPEPVRQKGFAKALGAALNRPAILPAPSFMVKLVMGELGASLLNSQKALPSRLVQEGFEFKYQTALSALARIYSRS